MMATYNGADFIEKQIQSICNQTYTKWKLIIRDDNSCDETVLIIKRLMAIDKRINLIENNTEFHGAYINFWSLINYTKSLETYDYYFFADQDDVWENNKIETFINNAEKYKDIPLYLHSDMRIINSLDEEIIPSINDIMGINMKNDKYTLFYSQGYVWGCASMINKNLFEIVRPLDISQSYINVISHDNFYAKHALIYGKVRFINKPLIRHRRHENNTTGQYSIKLSLRDVIKKGFLAFNETVSTHAGGYDQTLYTIDWMLKVNNVDSNLLIIKKSILKGGIYGVKHMLKLKIQRPQFVRTLGIYIIMLTKKYKKYMKYEGK